MLLKLSENLEKTQPLKRTYKGIVVDNKDPSKLGRVKCTVDGMYAGEKEVLPWVTPRRSDLMGGNATSGFYSVPEIGDELEIKFPTEDIYSPFYYGYWESVNTHLPEFDEDYPDAYGFRDTTGTKLVINKIKKSFKFEHVSGIKIEMDVDGNLKMDIPKDLTQTIIGDASTVAENIAMESNADTTIDSGGNTEITAGGDANVTASSINAEASGAATFKGTGGTNVGSSSSATNVDGSVISLAGGGPPIARLGDSCVGIGAHGVKVASIIVQGSGKVVSG